MNWQCKLVDIVGTKHVTYDPPIGNLAGKTFLVNSQGELIDHKDLPVGSMFYLPKDADMNSWPWYHAEKDDLSDFYFANNSHRQPLFVVLPDYTLFLIDGKCWNSGHKYGGWSVSGEAPNINVMPSINIGGCYHGWLQNGVLSEDVEDRIF